MLLSLVLQTVLLEEDADVDVDVVVGVLLQLCRIDCLRFLDKNDGKIIIYIHVSGLIIT